MPSPRPPSSVRSRLRLLNGVWPGMDWHEREAYDLYGVRFVGHPNLRRVLTYDAFEGHALRKDYPIDKRQPLIEMRDVRPVPTQLSARPCSRR